MMSNKFIVGMLLVLLIYHISSGIYMTREILAWVPDKKRRGRLLLMLWLIPVFGINMTNKKGQLGLFQESGQNNNATTNVGLIDIQDALNPGVRYKVEVIEEQKIEIPSTISQQDDLPHYLQSKPTEKR